jgi:hypothetical protein
VRVLVRLGPTPSAILAGITGGLVFASLLLLLESPTAGLRFWGPVALATLVSLGAAFGSQLLGVIQHGSDEHPAAGHVELSFSSASAGGLLPAADAMIRFDEELRLAAEFGRPLCIALLGFDRSPGIDSLDALEALRQLTAGAVRRQDIVTDRGDAEVLVLLLETAYAAGWVVAERIHRRVTAAGVGPLRCVLLAPAPDDTLRALLDELDSGLEASRAMKVVFADPTRLLAAPQTG